MRPIERPRNNSDVDAPATTNHIFRNETMQQAGTHRVRETRAAPGTSSYRNALAFANIRRLDSSSGLYWEWVAPAGSRVVSCVAERGVGRRTLRRASASSHSLDSAGEMRVQLGRFHPAIHLGLGARDHAMDHRRHQRKNSPFLYDTLRTVWSAR